ncbi:unnamed protein product [Euphydryas editha]|uniref:Uncharacterized protein n=1 Tax=Euphydryas editha TaxID=104508 RepID=A0AAU9UGT3_EUPED|nr:unnamed protein product [Euphydryas editha]
MSKEDMAVIHKLVIKIVTLATNISHQQAVKELDRLSSNGSSIKRGDLCPAVRFLQISLVLFISEFELGLNIGKNVCLLENKEK